MRTPEEVAREVLGCRLTLADDGRNVCETEHGGAWDCADEEQRLADLIRDRDAEVAEQAWDEGFKQGGPMHDVNLDDPDAHTRNPYREGGSA